MFIKKSLKDRCVCKHINSALKCLKNYNISIFRCKFLKNRSFRQKWGYPVSVFRCWKYWFKIWSNRFCRRLAAEAPRNFCCRKYIRIAEFVMPTLRDVFGCRTPKLCIKLPFAFEFRKIRGSAKMLGKSARIIFIFFWFFKLLDFLNFLEWISTYIGHEEPFPALIQCL